nr:putative F-box/LRR-repeat protein 23 [Ipomoea trifida]
MANPADKAASWVDLPRELTANILHRLSEMDIFQSAQVCSAWRRLWQDPSMWRYVDLWDLVGNERDWDEICREVVNRSEGQLKVSLFLGQPSDEEAVAIAENMQGLNHLTLGENEMSDEGLEAILDACPSLQSLNITDCNYVRLEGELEKRCSQQIKDLNHIHSLGFFDEDLLWEYISDDFNISQMTLIPSRNGDEYGDGIYSVAKCSYLFEN